MKRFSKAIAALLGTATPAGIIGLAAAFGWHVPPEVAVAIVSFLGVAATVLAPANAPSSLEYEDQEEISPATHPELYDDDTVAEYVASE